MKYHVLINETDDYQRILAVVTTSSEHLQIQISQDGDDAFININPDEARVLRDKIDEYLNESAILLNISKGEQQ